MPNFKNLASSTKVGSAIVFLLLILCLAYLTNYITSPVITNFDECVKANKSQILLIEPPTCTYKGQTFEQKIEDDRRIEEPKLEEEVEEITPLPKSSVEEIPEPEPIVKPAAEIYMTGPSSKEKGEYMEYSYHAYLNSTAAELYSSEGIKYAIHSPDCDRENIFVDENNTLSGSFNPLPGSSTITLRVDKNQLRSKSDLENSTYSIYDSKGNLIITNSIKVPNCYAVNEDNDRGEFSITLEEVNGSLLSGKYHYVWRFKMDSKARKLLEKGFRSKMNLDCKGWVEDEYSKELDYTWKAGSLGREEYDESVGMSVNVDKDGVKDKKTTTDTYTIYAHDGDKIFYGTYDAPNCK